MNLMQIDRISKTFQGLQALQSVTADIKRGLITALIGPNGAGKTTLLNIISGLLKPDSGAILMDGEDITLLPVHERPARGIARSFQILRGFPTLTVLENLMVGRHLNTVSGVWAGLCSLPSVRAENMISEKAALDSLAIFGLTAYAHETLSFLPHGIQRLVEITRVLVNEPKLVLLDEPTSGLNPADVDVLLEALITMRKEGKTVLLIEHNMRLVMEVANHVVVLNFGIKISEGTPEKITSDPQVMEAYLGRGFSVAST